MIHSRFSDSK